MYVPSWPVPSVQQWVSIQTPLNDLALWGQQEVRGLPAIPHRLHRARAIARWLVLLAELRMRREWRYRLTFVA